MELDSNYRERIGFGARVAHVAVAMGLGFVVLLVQFVRLQVLQGEELQRQSLENSIRLLRLRAPRGLITDVQGRPLVDNRVAFAIDFIPGEADNPATVLRRLAHYVEFDEAEVLRGLERSDQPRFAPHRVATDLTLDQVLPVEERRLELPGVVVSPEPQRRAVHGDLAGHVVGSIGEISADELAAREELGYNLGDWIGKTGVEAVGETTLRGTDGALQVQVYADAGQQPQMVMLTGEGRPTVRRDTHGRKLRTLGHRAAVAGDNIVLTLDLSLQQAAYAALGDQRGAVVVLEADTGAVRALVSKPGYDPNIFVRPARADERRDVLTDPAHPMVNRALRTYAPGSTAKVMMTYAGLATGTVAADTHVFCPGYFTLGRRYHCWKHGGHGELDTVQALAYSCDVFFFTLGNELGIDAIERAYRDFGLGRRTGIELPGESRGLVPGKAWKQRQAGLADRTWYAGETLNVAIGQGQLLASPLQLARMLTPFLNGGYLVQPYVIDRAETAEGTLLYRTAPTRERVPGWDARAGARVVQGLRQAVRARKPFYGTAWRAQLDHLDFIGKTGTAQVVKLVDAYKRRKTEEMPYEQRDHAWFVGAVLDREPRLVICVFVEHGGHASETSVLVADHFFNTIFPATPPAAEPDAGVLRQARAE